MVDDISAVYIQYDTFKWTFMFGFVFDIQQAYVFPGSISSSACFCVPVAFSRTQFRTPSLCNYHVPRSFLCISPKHLSDSLSFTFRIASHNRDTVPCVPPSQYMLHTSAHARGSLLRGKVECLVLSNAYPKAIGCPSLPSP